MRRYYLSSAAALILTVAGPAHAAPSADLEARVAELEAALKGLQAELAASKAVQAAQDHKIIEIEQRPTPAPPAPVAPADGFRIGPATVKWGGYVKLDAMMSDYSGGNPANSDLVRDFLLPGSIPIGGAGDTEAHFNARQTRFWLTSDAQISGHKVGTRVELDFQALPGTGDQRTTSPSNVALRRAYVTVDNWLFGQEWSVFQNTAVLPETADYIGPSEGTVFVRQAQVRYMRGPFTIGLENPETTITPFRGGTRIVADDASVPDLTARLDFKRPWGEIAVAGLMRQLSLQQGAIDDNATAWGLSASAKLKVGEKDDIRLMVTHGDGVGRYLGVNFSNDAVLDGAGKLHAIGVTAGFAAYRHVWSPTLRSTFIYSGQWVDNPVSLTGTSANKSAQSLHANLIWSPAKGIDVGVEVMRGRRELESGLDGDLKRVAAFAKYGF